MATGSGPDETQELPPRGGAGGGSPATGPVAPPPIQARARLRVGRYEIEDELGRGGMGIVYRAWDGQLQRAVALKTLLAEGQFDDRAQQRLLREARTASQLHHPNIVELYDCFEEGGQVYLTMRLIAGTSLSRRLREQGPLSHEAAAQVARDLARALEHAHARGVIHRDIKPANVLMEQERPILTDFGLARAQEARDHELTRESQVLGTPAYMAPELIRYGASRSGPASDQYALGVVLYEMLAGRPPVRGGSAHEILAAIVSERLEPLPSSVPYPLAWICARAMAPRTADRFAGLGEMADALDRWLRGERVLDTRQNLARVGQLAAGRMRLPALIGLGLLFALGLHRAGTAAWEAREARARAERAEVRLATMEARVEALRAAGQQEQAVALFGSFAEFPENGETPALARAWLGEARRRALDGDPDGAEQALTMAYGLTDEPELQVQALLGLARSFRARDQWDRLRSVLAVLSRRGDAPEQELRPLRRDLAVTTGDIATARRLGDDPELRPLLDALAQVTPLGVEATEAFRFDEDGDGRPELGLYDQQSGRLHVLPEGLASTSPQFTQDISAFRDPRAIPAIVRAVASGEELLVLQNAGTCSLGRARAGRFEIVGARACVNGLGGLLVDVDDDAREDLLFADNRELLLGPYEALSALTPVDATVNHVNSEIRGMVLEDLDGDGERELALATAGWGAYDLRVLRPRGARWEMLDRRQLGEQRGLHTLRDGGRKLLATVQYHDPSQPLDWRVFGPSLPHGSARGVYLFSWEGGRLVSRGQIPWPTPPERTLSERAARVVHVDETMLVGDLDGDGVDELAAGLEGLWTWIYRRASDGGWVNVALDGQKPIAFLDLDGDGDDELILRESERGLVHAVGLGGGDLPRMPRDAPLPRPPPGDLDPDLRAAWARIEDLVAIGMQDAAYERLQTLADLGAGTAERGLALMRAAEIVASTRPEQALSLYAQAAEEPDFAAPALEAAFWLHDRAMRVEPALDAGARRVALPDPPEALVARLDVLRARAAAPTLDLVSPGALHPAWRFAHPDAPRASPEGLELSWAGVGVVGRIPVRWLGGPAGVEVRVRTERQDWSAWLNVGFDTEMRFPSRFLAIATTGGGDVFNRTTVCADVPGGLTVALRPEGRSTIRWTYDPVERKETCSLVDEEGRERGRTVYDTVQGDLPEESWFFLRHNGDGALSRLRFDRIRLTGFALREAPPDPGQELNGLLARGQVEAALGQLGPEPSLARLIALDDQGRTEERDRLLRAALAADPTLGGARSRLLLAAPERWAAPMREALGPRWVEAFLEAYEVLTEAHPRESPALQALTTLLPDLERAPPSSAVAQLFNRRSSAWRQLGQIALAEADARRAVEMVRAIRDPWPGTLSRALMQRSLAELARGEDELALSTLLEALRAAPAPEVVADVVAHRPEVAPLRALEGWSLVEEVRAGRPLPSP